MIAIQENSIKLFNDEVEERISSPRKDMNLKTAKVKMDEIREENNKLKLTLSQIMKDYNSLKLHVQGLVQDQEADKPKKKSTESSTSEDTDSNLINISLSLGVFNNEYPKNRDENSKIKEHQDFGIVHDGLELGLHSLFSKSKDSKSKNPSPETSLDHQISKEGGEENKDTKHASQRSPKTSRSDDEDKMHEQQSPLKKPRVSVRAVCTTQTMNDGCQWRKYGQKISKGNPCPRAYYRCTVSSTCPVRKQVQRCADNMSILTTTYEGTHDHPLPPSAATMASATSAAVTMLNSGSTTSPKALDLSTSFYNNTPNLLGFNLMTSSMNTNNSYMIPKASISTSQSHPTITLDLTKPNHHMMTSSPFNKLFSSSSSFSSSLGSSAKSSFSFSNPTVFDNTKNLSKLSSLSESFVYDKERELIMRDPTFQSALKAAITSIIGTKNYNDKLGDENFHLSFSQPSVSNGNSSVRNWSQLWNLS